MRTLVASAVLALLATTAVAATAQPTELPPVLRVDRARIGVIPGASVTVIVSGANGPVTVQRSFDGVEGVYDPLTHRLLVSGRTPGSGTLHVIDRSGNTATIEVLVAPPAGVLPADVDVALAGNVSAAFVAARIRNAIDRAAGRAPGTAR